MEENTIERTMLTTPLNPPLPQCAVSGSLLVSELEEFFYEMGEDWHLWDEEEKGQYLIQRTFDAMKKFIEYHKSKQ